MIAYAPTRISKLEAARRQLAEAIRLFFEDRDEVSVHTLAAAAHGVIADLSRRDGIESPEQLLADNPLIRDDKRATVRRMLRGAQNFFKHADKDPEGEIDFDSTQSLLLMLEACEMYKLLTGRVIREFGPLWAWLALEDPDAFREDPAQRLPDEIRAWRGNKAAFAASWGAMGLVPEDMAVADLTGESLGTMNGSDQAPQRDEDGG